MTAFNLFEALFADDRATSVAVLCDQRRITYGELREQVWRTAEILDSINIGAGDRVALLLHDSPEFIASFAAIISLGAIAVPINMGLSRAEQRFILKDCGACAAIVEAEICDSLFENSIGADNESQTSVPAPSGRGLGRGREYGLHTRPLTPTLSQEERASTIKESLQGSLLPELKELLIVNRSENATSFKFSEFNMQDWQSPTRKRLTRDFPFRAAEDAPAFILYTSGSTGAPKGAIHTQAHIDYTNRTYCAEVLRLRDGDRLFSSSRLPFAYGLGNAFTFPLLNGVTTILCREKPLPEVIGRVFKDYRPTIFFGVPVVFRMLIDHHRNVGPLDCSSLRLCVSAGEALPAQLGEEWQSTFGVEVLDGIGSTEMLHMFFSNHEGEVRYGSSGTLLRGYEAKLIDHEGKPTPESEVGNLWIRGGSAALGYWHQPETTAETFVDGWVRTGDLYRRDCDGCWWHMGRSDDCFKPTGQWVSPVEVEGVLLRHEDVGRVAVVEGFDEAGLSCVCAFVVPDNLDLDRADLEASLSSLCENALPRFKRPRRYIFVSELPYTATGKIQRFKLREQLRAQRASAATD
jgi:benzoate-CoA ligase family protein